MSPTQQQDIVNSPKPDPAPTRSSKKRTRLPQPDRAPTYRGVRRRSWGRYVSEIRLPGQKTRVWLGSFGSPEMAARAYDSAAFFLKGNSACLNFPDLVGSLPQPESCSTRDIQMAAAKAAFITKSENTDLSNRAECGRTEGSVDELPPESAAWLGSDGCYYDPGTEWFEEVKDAPLLSPLRFDSGSSSSISSWEELFGSSVDDEEFLLASCFQL